MVRIVGSADLQINAYNPATQFGAPEQSVSLYARGPRDVWLRDVRSMSYGEW
jgi:hypothetical protein